jgi:hypothetical protein
MVVWPVEVFWVGAPDSWACVWAAASTAALPGGPGLWFETTKLVPAGDSSLSSSDGGLLAVSATTPCPYRY